MKNAGLATEFIFGFFQGLREVDRAAPTEQIWQAIGAHGSDGINDDEGIRWNFSCAATVINNRKPELVRRIEDFFNGYRQQLLSLESSIRGNCMRKEAFKSLKEAK
jgi:hypothetical protein